jgi:hypothetical protein
MSKEHVIPQWILREFDMEKTILMAKHVNFAAQPFSERRHDFLSFVAGCVCEDYNCGWMSRMEAAVQPVLTPLFRARKASRVAQEQLRVHRDLIVRWVLKTAVALNYSSNYRKLVPAAHAHLLFSGGCPTFLFARAGFLRGFGIKWYQSQQVTLATKVGEPLPSDIYNFSFQLGHLCLNLTHIPGAIRRVGGCAHVQLSPDFKARSSRACIYDDFESFDVDGVFET